MRRAITAMLLMAFMTVVTAQAQTYSAPTGDENRNEGYGMHTGPTTAFQVSGFTINPRGTTCQVGTVNPNGAFGPFEMVMFSVKDVTYKIDGGAKTITSDGRMRSITRMGGAVVEDIVTSFIAFAKDNAPGVPQPNTSDVFELHFITPMWNVANPLCTPSERIPGGCKFGGNIFVGDVNVSN